MYGLIPGGSRQGAVAQIVKRVSGVIPIHASSAHPSTRYPAWSTTRFTQAAVVEPGGQSCARGVSTLISTAPAAAPVANTTPTRSAATRKADAIRPVITTDDRTRRARSNRPAAASDCATFSVLCAAYV